MVLSIKFIFKTEVEGHYPQENSFRHQFGTRVLKRYARFYRIDPHVANLHRGKTRQNVPDVAARRLGQDEAYLTVRDILFRARSQMARYHASAAVFTGVGLQHEGQIKSSQAKDTESTFNRGLDSSH
jgi:hypothetical protein